MTEEALKESEGNPTEIAEGGEQPGEVLEGAQAENPNPEEVEIVFAEGDQPSSENMVPESKMRRRIRKLNAKVEHEKAGKTEAEKRVEMLEEENQLYRERLAGGQPQPRRQGGLPPRPRPEDFASDEDFNRAYEQWDSARSVLVARRIAAQEREQLQQQEQQQAQQQETESKLRKHFERADEANYPGYEDAEDAAIEVLGRNVAQQIMINAPDSAKTMLILGKSPEKARQFKELIERNPVKGLMQLGEFVGKTTINRKHSDAPEPDEQFSGGGQVLSDKAWQKRIDKMRANGSTVREILKVKEQAMQAGADVF